MSRVDFLNSSAPIATAHEEILEFLTDDCDIISLLFRDLHAGVKMDKEQGPWIILSEINRGNFSKALRVLGKKEANMQTKYKPPCNAQGGQ